jgi:hypothetical protein
MLPRVVLERIWSSVSSYNPFGLSAARRTVIASRLWMEVNRRYPFRDIRAAVDVAIQSGQFAQGLNATNESRFDVRKAPVNPALEQGDPCYQYRTLLVYRSAEGEVVHTTAVNVQSNDPLTREQVLERAHAGLRAGAAGTPVPPAVQRGVIPYSVDPGDSHVIQVSRNAHC